MFLLAKIKPATAVAECLTAIGTNTKLLNVIPSLYEKGQLLGDSLITSASPLPEKDEDLSWQALTHNTDKSLLLLPFRTQLA